MEKCYRYLPGQVWIMPALENNIEEGGGYTFGAKSIYRKPRPGVIVSDKDMIIKQRMALMVPLSTKEPNSEDEHTFEVSTNGIGDEDRPRSFAVCSRMISIAVSDLKFYCCTLSDDDFARILRTVGSILVPAKMTLESIDDHSDEYPEQDINDQDLNESVYLRAERILERSLCMPEMRTCIFRPVHE